ncbi:ion transporter [Halomonas sp. HP20-15]|uniref:ion transporter n=1 Tax=Halomonas sp. HP20-15 TaxID=3085901 RepID=UPI0029828970|nr:ion transporter [Halomonas sp. HP20-15]MDW5378466.1 ion transporter [Halomonas sp. HP20-15]
MTPTRPHRQPSSPRERFKLAWDVLVIILVIANLALLLFDSLYLVPPLHDAFASLSPQLQKAYQQNVHEHFFAIDLAFVSVFVLDVLLGWIVAIAERRYHRWFFYPFVHWYDVLGCIPLTGFRWLRLLRVVSLLFRLQRLGLIEIRNWYLFGVVHKYYDILLEELSDRVAVRLIGSIQEEIRHSNALSQRLSDEVLAPRKEQLVDEIAQRLEAGLNDIYTDNRALIARYISALVGRTLQESPEIQRLQRLPMGRQLSEAMDQTLSDLAGRLIHEAVGGLRSPEFSQLLRRATDSGMDILMVADTRSERITEQVLIETLELLKEQIATKRWLQRYD